MFRPRHKILWPHKDHSPRTSGGEEKERQTEETMDRQCRGMDGKTICRDRHWHPTAADGGDCCTACQDGVPTTPRRVKEARQCKDTEDV